jgi:RES domain-containing protein
MRAWRLTRAVYSADPLSGHGAQLAGSRWNSPGVRMAYSSTSRPLAVLEMLVHVSRDTVPADSILIPIDVPDALVAEAASVPSDWAELPYGPKARDFGDRWVLKGASVALLVPSVVLPAERNLLINPAHPAVRRVRVQSPEAFAFDRRLLT